MLGRRVVLVLALVAAGAIAGCGKADPEPVQVVAGQRAGVVREVTGTVTAQRGTEPARPLHAGDPVSGDDDIQTGADGTVLIELDHNHVTFTMAPGKTQRVSASLAWRQPIAAARPTTTDEHSAAAGRPVERSAVDTSASAVERARGGDGGGGGGGSGGDRVAAEPPRADPPKRDRPREQPKTMAAAPGNTKDTGDSFAATDDKTASQRNFAAADIQAAPPPPPPPAPDDSADKADDSPDPEIQPVQPVAPPPPVQLAFVVKGALREADVARVIRTAAQACWAPGAPRLILNIATSGRIKKLSSTDKALADCVVQKLDGVTFPAKPKETKVTITVVAPGL